MQIPIAYDRLALNLPISKKGVILLTHHYFLKRIEELELWIRLYRTVNMRLEVIRFLTTETIGVGISIE